MYDIKKMSILTSVLFALSLVVYFWENRNVSTGDVQTYLFKSLDVEALQSLQLQAKDKESLELKREGRRFVISSHQAFPADSKRINDLVYKLASLQVKEKLAEKPSAEELQTWGLDDKNFAFEIKAFARKEEPVLHLRVGNSKKSAGNYLYKVDSQEVYLSDGSFWLESSALNYTDRKILNIEKDQLVQAAFSGDGSFQLLRNGDSFVLEGLGKRKIDTEAVKKYLTEAKELRFDAYLRPEQASDKQLKFSQSLSLSLQSGIIYRLSFASRKDEHYVKLSAELNSDSDKILVSAQADEKELKAVDAQIRAKREAQKINNETALWVYKISDYSFKTWFKDSKDFLLKQK